jgi:hypothetical protein
MKRITRDGGRLVSKEFDDGATIFNPVDPYLNAKVLEGVARAQAQSNDFRPEDGHGSIGEDRLTTDESSGPQFNSFMGRKMYGYFRQVGFKDVSIKTYAIEKVHPLVPEAKRYLQGIAGWLGGTAAPYLSEEDRQIWQAAFDPAAADFILDREDFYVCMIEMITVGVVGSE